jgi:hypothetical protein
LFFVRDVVRVISIRYMLRDVNQEFIAFYTRCCTCKKHKMDDKVRQSRAPYFCMRCCVCKKYKIDVKRRQLRALYFCMRCCTCKNIRSMIRDVNQEPLTFCTRWFPDRACNRKCAPCVNGECLLLGGHSLANRPNA